MLAGWIWSSPIGTGADHLVAELNRGAQHLRRQQAGRPLGLGDREQLAVGSVGLRMHFRGSTISC